MSLKTKRLSSYYWAELGIMLRNSVKVGNIALATKIHEAVELKKKKHTNTGRQK